MANERLTEFQMVYDMSDITALGDSSPSTDDNKSFADLSMLKKMQLTPGQMTLEHNYCILDGTQEEFDDEPTTIGFFTDFTSDENGDFETNPTITIDFTTFHSSYALTVNFIDDYPLEMKCSWYQDGSIIFLNTYNVDSNNFIIRDSVQNYNKIVLEFTKALPYRYVKINYIRYGMLMYWTQNEIKTGTLVQETDRISKMLSINNLTFSVIDPEDETNPGNKKGLHNYFQKTQIMYPYEIVNDKRIELGRYFLDKFAYQKNVCTINAVSYIGLFETTQFETGTIYNGVRADVVLGQIFETLGIEDYTIDEVTSQQLLYGTIKPCSCKDALQKVLFVCNSVIDTSDLEDIQIYKSTEVISGDLKCETKFSTKVTRIDYTSGVRINYKTFRTSEETSNVVDDEYNEGSYRVVFNEPHTNYVATNATITNSGTYFVKFDVEGANTSVIIEAGGYTEKENSITVNRPYKEAGEGENVQEFSTELCNYMTAQDLATKLLRYYNDRLQIEVKYMANDATMNERYIIDNPTRGMEDYIAIFTSRTLDLTGGFIDNAKFIGHFDTADYYLFMDNDLIMDENGVI